MILNLPLESVQTAIERAAQDSNNTPNQNWHRLYSRAEPILFF
jgi:hypothetical protein